MTVNRARKRLVGLGFVLLPELRGGGEPRDAAMIGGGHAVRAVHHHRQRVARRGVAAGGVRRGPGSPGTAGPAA